MNGVNAVGSAMPAQVATSRPDVFVSYSRVERAFAAKLLAALIAAEKNVWLDLENIPPAAEWREQIEAGIEAASAFLFVLSPDSSSSAICRDELAHATELGKRIIPVVCSDVDAAAVPAPLAALNWISLRDEDDFEDGMTLVLEALETDLAWREVHARLSIRSREWEERNHDRSFLLTGSDLADAEGWLADRGSHKETATPAQTRYILASRQAATRRQRLVLGAVLVAFVVAAALSVAAFYQRNAAVEQRQRAERETKVALAQARLATARQLASDAQALPPDRYPTRLLLAAQALKLRNTFEARRSLLTMLEAIPQIQVFLHHRDVWPVALSALKPLVAVRDSGGVGLYDTVRAKRIALLRVGGKIEDLAITRDGGLVAVAQRGRTMIWELDPKPHLLHTLPARVPEIEDAWSPEVAFSPDNSTLAATTPAEIVLWDARRGTVRRRIQSPLPDSIEMSSPAFSTDGRRIAFVMGGNSELDAVHIVGIQGNGAGTRLPDTSGTVGLVFSPVNPRVLAVTENSGRDCGT